MRIERKGEVINGKRKKRMNNRMKQNRMKNETLKERVQSKKNDEDRKNRIKK